AGTGVPGDRVPGGTDRRAAQPADRPRRSARRPDRGSCRRPPGAAHRWRDPDPAGPDRRRGQRRGAGGPADRPAGPEPAVDDHGRQGLDLASDHRRRLGDRPRRRAGRWLADRPGL
ncbi:MAG: hypothetical protein AVDCRST_MAG61-289, partial [uncultured Friedmanniella sp.]